MLYRNFDDLQSSITSLKPVEDWKKELKCDSITIKRWNATYLLPEFESSLFICWLLQLKVYEWLLPEDHETYKSYKTSLQSITVSVEIVWNPSIFAMVEKQKNTIKH